MTSREENLARLQEAPLDVLILGGGINGAGIARDLALRSESAGLGLRIGLVEQRHFASGTSGKNSHLIHGGLRYLKTLEFGLVREALRERETVLAIAGPLARQQPFLIPMYGWLARLFYGAGLWMYDALAGSRTLGRHRSLTRADAARLEPELSADGLTSAAIFFDAQIHSARFVLENIFDAARHGAMVCNYARGERVGPHAINVHDTLSGRSFEVHAGKLVDATGPWGDDLRLVRGSHIVVPRLNRSDNAIAHFEPGGRIVFVIPWGERHDLSLVGTTDIDHTAGPEDVRISAEEVRYLLGVLKRLYPRSGELRPISAFSSLRPLVRDHTSSPTRASRGHRIWNSADGVLHVAGGKYTTYRAMSEEAVDQIAQEIAPQLVGIHKTAATPVLIAAGALAADPGVSEGDLSLLTELYGAHAPLVLGLLPERDSPPLSRVQLARIAYAIEYEMARRLADLLFVSTYWGYEARWTEKLLAPIAAEMGSRLGWDSERTRQEIELALKIMGGWEG